MEELNRCMEKNSFCPVSIPKYSRSFRVFFFTSVLAIILLNWMFDSPLLLSLYAYPLVFVSMFTASFPLFLLLGFLLIGSLFLVHSPNPAMLVIVVALIVLMLIVKRVVNVSLNHYRGKKEQEEILLNTVLTLAKTIDTRDAYTAFHSSQVADYARNIARELNLSETEVDSIYLAGLIHDIGKIGTPDYILQKESKLTDEEYEIIKKHPEDGFNIIKDIKRFEELGISEMVRFHHERPDGKGYPLGLKGEEIPLGARILSVADAFDAMTTNRSYRQKLSIETAADELRRNSGAQFDPAVANAFIQVLTREGKLEPEMKEFVSIQAALVK